MQLVQDGQQFQIKVVATFLIRFGARTNNLFNIKCEFQYS